MIEISFTQDLCKIFNEKNKNIDTKKSLRSHHFIEKDKSRKYLSGMLSIDIDEADLEQKINQFINDISDFNTTYILKCYNKKI